MQTVLQEKIELKLVRSHGRFQLQFIDGRSVEQAVCEFLLTFSFLKSHNIEDALLNTDDEFDFVTVPLTCKGDHLNLPLADYAAFREVYFREMFELKLEDMLIRQGVRLASGV